MKPGRFLALLAALVVLAMATGALAVYLGVQYNKGQAAATVNTCRKVNLVQAEIKATIARSKRALPVNAYYKAHPVELAKAEVEIDRELKTFSPLEC